METRIINVNLKRRRKPTNIQTESDNRAPVPQKKRSAYYDAVYAAREAEKNPPSYDEPEEPRLWPFERISPAFALTLLMSILIVLVGVIIIASGNADASYPDGNTVGTAHFNNITPQESDTPEPTFTAPIEPTPTLTLEPARPAFIATRLGITVDSYDPDVDYSTLIDGLMNIAESVEDADAILALCEVYELQHNLLLIDLGREDDLTFNFGVEATFEEIIQTLYPVVENTTPEVVPLSSSEIDLDTVYHGFIDYTERDLRKGAAVLYAEAGASWCTDYHVRCTASVMVCRTIDKRYKATTIWDVVYQAGQYPGTCNSTYYDERCYTIMKEILDNGPVVYAVFQANFKQGTEIIEVFDYRDQGHSVTYICN